MLGIGCVRDCRVKRKLGIGLRMSSLCPQGHSAGFSNKRNSAGFHLAEFLKSHYGCPPFESKNKNRCLYVNTVFFISLLGPSCMFNPQAWTNYHSQKNTTLSMYIWQSLNKSLPTKKKRGKLTLETNKKKRLFIL